MSGSKPVCIVTGAAGLLGSAVCRIAPGRGFQTVGVVFNRSAEVAPADKMIRLDLSNEAAAETVADLRPRVIVHCAAMTDVNACQDRPEEARRHNVLAAANMARAAKSAGAYLVHISTESVFSGEKGNYSEADEPRPLNVYARTKRDAEIEVAGILPEAAILRTTIYGWNVLAKKSLAEWVLDRLRRREEVPGFEDAVFSPLPADDLADAIMDFCGNKPGGIFHAAGSEACSKYDFARKVAEVFGLNADLVRPARLAEAGMRAARPLNVSLNVKKAQEILGRPFRDLTAGLKRFRDLEP